MHSISYSPENPLALLCKLLATTLRYRIMYLINFILKPIQTKISVCFDPIIEPSGSHQLARRVISFAHTFLICPFRSTWAGKDGKGVFNSVLSKHRVSRFRNISGCHATVCTLTHNHHSRKFTERHPSARTIFEWTPKQVQLKLVMSSPICQRMLGVFKLMPCSTYFFTSLHTLVFFPVLLCTFAFFLVLGLEICSFTFKVAAVCLQNTC